MLPTVLRTDAYQLSMAEAGFPLREETFYFSFRRGGWHYLPFDPAEEVAKLLPSVTLDDRDWLAAHGYPLSTASYSALTSSVKVNGLPKGSWFYEREPIFSVTGPSALASWLGTTIIQMHFPIQAATRWLMDGHTQNDATCGQEADLLTAVYDAAHAGRAFMVPRIAERAAEYYDAVRERGKALLSVVQDPARLFEVGMRAASCQAQHQIAMIALSGIGINRTSNVESARVLGIDPVGTMGHEHIQRFGSSLRAFEAMRDRVPGFISYLPDTYSTLGEGIPAALKALAADPRRASGIRFDAETYAEEHYVSAICRLRARGLAPRLLLESGWNDIKTLRFEELRTALRWPADLQGYGIGGYFVKPPWNTFLRDDVAAVYKLSWSGRPVRKLGDEPNGAKASLPGKPVLWRGLVGAAGYDGPVGWVCQEGEGWVPPMAVRLTGCESTPAAVRFNAAEVKGFQGVKPVGYSPETLKMMETCAAETRRAFEEARDVAG